ncbi:hypothetical protein AMECASPLE_029856 [Ameca splendens]|uniref:Uncharacterized protein n=1 Tax=Ameca splendens TaxID=208324 RepID=A0ABV0Y5U2_9TELE
MCLYCMVRPAQLKAGHLKLLRLAATLVPFTPHVDNLTNHILSPGNLFLCKVHVRGSVQAEKISLELNNVRLMMFVFVCVEKTVVFLRQTLFKEWFLYSDES